MTFTEHTYGFHRTEIKKLLRERLNAKVKMRYHEQLAAQYKERAEHCDQEIKRLEEGTFGATQKVDLTYNDDMIDVTNLVATRGQPWNL